MNPVPRRVYRRETFLIGIVTIFRSFRRLRGSGWTGTDVFPRICSQAAIDHPNTTGCYAGRGLVDLFWSQKPPILHLDNKQPLCLASASALILDPPCTTC